jgi:DNA-binding PadR family transcriptional regulator
MTASHAFGDHPLEHSWFRAMSGPRRPRHGHPRPHARGGWKDIPFGPGFPFGGPPFRRGRKARRGDVRAAALLLLAEEPRNGYQLMQEIEERSEGNWRPSPGSVYPALQQLEDERLVRVRESEGGRLFELTESGHAYVEENRAELGAPWEAFTRDVTDQTREVANLLKEVAYAAAQVLRAGNNAQLEGAQKVLADAKRSLYLILADAGASEDEPG